MIPKEEDPLTFKYWAPRFGGNNKGGRTGKQMFKLKYTFFQMFFLPGTEILRKEIRLSKDRNSVGGYE